MSWKDGVLAVALFVFVMIIGTLGILIAPLWDRAVLGP